MQTWKIKEFDLTHAIIAVECSDDVIHHWWIAIEVVNDERERRPDVQVDPHWYFEFTNESQIEGGVVIKKRHVSSVDTRAPALSTPVYIYF